MSKSCPETTRLNEDRNRDANWKRWGPYLADRQWGTVREDYSEHADAWGYFSHDQAISRAFRWGEDGLLGFTDRQCRLCFGISLWNGNDPILKERLYGLTNPQGNHGEDVKELYYHLDATPTNTYNHALYKYPQSAFPYEELVQENANRGKHDDEYELLDTGVFDDGYFDVNVEYAKGAPEDILIRISITNRGEKEAPIWCLPTLWFRNTWVWGCDHEGSTLKPSIRYEDGSVYTSHESLHPMHFDTITPPDDLWITENETNSEKLFGTPAKSKYTKDAFHRRLIGKDESATSPNNLGTKVAAVYKRTIAAGATEVIELRLTSTLVNNPSEFSSTFEQRIAEADLFYNDKIPATTNDDERLIMRRAFAGLLWTRKFYHYVIKDWQQGDPNHPLPPNSRDRNKDWTHLFNRDVISLPDAWEYPWYAAWDLAFHMIPFAEIDPDFAKQQLKLFLREWYMHPNGQIPAYEYNFSDVNPPVHAWACWRVYKIAYDNGEQDLEFLASCFQKLLLNFTWWVNRKDIQGDHIFSGGFLGLDNIGIFDRSQPMPNGGDLEQADATAWMAFYCKTMLRIAVELATHDRSYEDMASKFFEHFVHIADAMNNLGGTGLYDREDGFYYDWVREHDQRTPLKVRSLVGLMPLVAAAVFDDTVFDDLPEFAKRTNWFLKHRADLSTSISYFSSSGSTKKRLLAIPTEKRLRSVLSYLFDEEEFLSPYGIRSLSIKHREEPGRFNWHEIRYEEAESQSNLFGGNSNWRGPIWLPMNYLIVESLERFHNFYGEDFKIEFPTGSGNLVTLNEARLDISRRLSQLFLKNEDNQRPLHNGDPFYAEDGANKNLPLFYEYFNAETGKGLGASHQTGWTALVNRFIRKQHRELEND